MAKKDSLAVRKPDDIFSMITTGTHVGGQQLIDTALARLRDNYGETVLAFVTAQMDQMMRLRAQREQLDGHILYVEQRMAAIQSGEFTVSGYPPRIVFNEAGLNDGL